MHDCLYLYVYVCICEEHNLTRVNSPYTYINTHIKNLHLKSTYTCQSNAFHVSVKCLSRASQTPFTCQSKAFYMPVGGWVLFRTLSQTYNTHTHTHTHIYIYIHDTKFWPEKDLVCACQMRNPTQILAINIVCPPALVYTHSESKICMYVCVYVYVFMLLKILLRSLQYILSAPLHWCILIVSRRCVYVCVYVCVLCMHVFMLLRIYSDPCNTFCPPLCIGVYAWWVEYVCMYVCMYVCVYVCVHVSMDPAEILSINTVCLSVCIVLYT